MRARTHDRLLHGYIRLQALALVPLYVNLTVSAWVWGEVLYPRCCRKGA